MNNVVLSVVSAFQEDRPCERGNPPLTADLAQYAAARPTPRCRFLPSKLIFLLNLFFCYCVLYNFITCINVNFQSRVAHPACLPNSDRSLELTQCGVLSNEVTGTEIPIVTHSCTPTPPQSFNRCRSETPASRTTHCSDIT